MYSGSRGPIPKVLNFRLGPGIGCPWVPYGTYLFLLYVGRQDRAERNSDYVTT